MTPEDLIEGYLDEAKIDFIALGAIAGDVRHDLKISDGDQIMLKSLEIVQVLTNNSIFPGELDSSVPEGFQFWLGTDDELIRRIEREWIALKRVPDLDDICWFALKPLGMA